MNSLFKAIRSMKFVKQLLEQDKKEQAIDAIVIIYDTNRHDAELFVRQLEKK